MCCSEGYGERPPLYCGAYTSSQWGWISEKQDTWLLATQKLSFEKYIEDVIRQCVAMCTHVCLSAQSSQGLAEEESVSPVTPVSNPLSFPPGVPQTHQLHRSPHAHHLNRNHHKQENGKNNTHLQRDDCKKRAKEWAYLPDSSYCVCMALDQSIWLHSVGWCLLKVKHF